MALIRLMRPQDWVKNVFLLLPVLFWMASPLHTADGLSDFSAILQVALTFVGFCFLSSAVYSVNDALDAERDRTHPVKRNRPVASGAVSARMAIGLSFLLVIVAMLLAGFVGWEVQAVFGLYLAMQVVYNMWAKYVVLIDVVIIAMGFVLRAAAGAFAINIQLSVWLLLCVFFLCLYLGFIKRLCDFASAERESAVKWRSPAGYNDKYELNWLLGVSAVLTISMYLGYALSPHAAQLFGARAAGFALLAPLVIIVVHRFYRRANEGLSDSPLAAILEDRIVQFGSVFYALGIVMCLYVPAVERALEKLLLTGSAG